MNKLILVILLSGLLGACGINDSQEAKDRQAVDSQQSQYAKNQSIPTYNHSLERELLIQLYNIRNERVATHSVWRSDYGIVEGDCASMGFGIPYDTSLTNPLGSTDEDQQGDAKTGALTSIGQPEPNGVFASTNTSATWVMCIGPTGLLEPHYIEAKVSVYPGPVEVNYATNRVIRAGSATVTMGTQKDNSIVSDLEYVKIP